MSFGNAERNEQIYAACVAGERYSAIGRQHAISGARAEQIFRAEAARRHPDVVAKTANGVGFRKRFLAALNP